MNNKNALFSSLILSSFLVACGGGDNDSPTTDTGLAGETSGTGGGSSNVSTSGSNNSAPLKITSSNAKDIAGFAANSLDFGFNTSKISSQTAADRELSTSRQTTQAKLFFPCSAGGTTSFDAGDGDDQLEVGDFFQLNFNNCAEPETGKNYTETTNGSIRFDITQIASQNDLAYNISMDTTYSTDNGHSGSSKGGGTISLKRNGNGGQQISGRYKIASTFDGKSLDFNPLSFSLTQTGNQYSYDYNASMSGSAINGTLTMATNPALTGTMNEDDDDLSYPTAGKLTIKGGNSSIVLDADTGNPSTVQITTDENGAVTSETVQWSELNNPQSLI
jgi:hypothetical protein